MKILIVDDEHFACAALEKLVKDYFQQHNMQLVCASFEESRFALEYLNANKVDLLITDIKMAGINGLELAAFVQEAGMDLSTVIISGYADFTYAQAALQHEVSDYILKPITRSQIYACLDKQVQRYQMRCEEKKQEEESKKHSLYHQITSNPNFETERFFEGLNKENKHLSAVMALISSEDIPLSVDEVLQDSCEKIKGADVIGVENSNGTIVLLVYFIYDTDQSLIRDKILKQCNRYYKNLMQKNIKQRISIAISQNGDVNILHRLFLECSYALNERILNPEKYLFDYEKIRDNKGNHMLLDSSLEHELKQSFAFKDPLLSISIVDRQMKKIVEKKNASLSNLTDFISQMSVIINKVICEHNCESGNQLTYVPETFLTQFRTIDEITEYFHIHIHRVHEAINQGDAPEDIVSRLIKYVENNYFLNLSLEEISKNIFYLNASYLSRLFKSQTGVAFSKYLLDYRMEKAREYLCDHQEISVQEVASLTGFSDGSYFVKQFKKQYEETPGAYQKRMLSKMKEK